MELSPALNVEALQLEALNRKAFSFETPVHKGSERPAIKIAIIGCGSRGLTVLERLCALAGESRSRVEISLFDPQKPGPGLHSPEQPEYLMLNTVASQISMFPDQAALGGHSGRHGPNFHEWCLRFKSAERAVRANEFLPRAWLGEYLAWTYEEVIRNLGDHVSVTHHAKRVDNVEHTDLGGFILSTGDEKHSIEWLVITVGHPQAQAPVDKPFAGTRHLAAYPQPHSLNSIQPAEVVGVQGLGLAAMDVVAGLTVGRGGRYIEGPEGLRYQASGQEPRIFMYSRSGLPYRTRPDIAPHRIGGPALIYTLSAVADLRANYPQGLDFETQVLPLIKAEMLAEYYGMLSAQRGESGPQIKAYLASAFWAGDIEERALALSERFAVAPLDPSAHDPANLHPLSESYPQWMRTFFLDDIRQSTLGLDHSPIKAAFEVWRSCREQLRRTVDNHGLTAASHRVFFDKYAPLVNRLVAGPQKERHQELLALVDQGVVQWVHATQIMHTPDSGRAFVQLEHGSVDLDVLVCAHVCDTAGNHSQPKIIRQLLTSGIIHTLRDNPARIHVDSHGKAQPNLWITGPMVEGATYYNHYVPSAGSYSRAFIDADRIAREMLGIHAQAGVGLVATSTSG